MSIEYKPGVLFCRRHESGLYICAKPEILVVPTLVEEIFKFRHRPVVVTSCMDGRHSYRSFHWKGLAMDLRSRHLPLVETKEAILDQMREVLGSAYDVVLEDPGGDNEHYHIEFDPKGL